MKEILLIGNGPSAAKYTMGNAIDAFPYVVRFNTFRIHGFKEYVGTKCDVWIAIDNFPQWQGLYDYKEVYFANPTFTEPNRYWDNFKKVAPNAIRLPQWVWQDVAKEMKAHPSTGALAAYFFSKSYDRVYLYGFDCFQADKHHYGDELSHCHHKADKERAFVNKLISEGVIRQFNNYTVLHDHNPGYGVGGAFKEKIVQLAQEKGLHSILDYGCGKGRLVRAMDMHIVPLGHLCVEGYDPHVEEFCKKPEHEFDMLVSTDLLEHISEEDLSGVFADMLSYQPRMMFHVISDRKAVQILPDGTNAHKTIKDANWWWSRLHNEFPNYDVEQIEHNEKNRFTTYYCKRKEGIK